MKTNTKMATYCKTMKVEIGDYECVKRPEFENSFHCIYSPENFALRPRDFTEFKNHNQSTRLLRSLD